MYKAIIIGSGPAGYTAAIKISKLGGKVAIVERDLVGGICTNWGCTPSKAMISSAKYAKMAREAANYGINLGNVSVDFTQVAKRRDLIMSNTRKEIRHLLDEHNVDIFHGSGEVVGPNTVKVTKYNNPNVDLTDASGNSPYTDEYKTFSQDVVLEAENIIIATGSAPLVPPFLQKQDDSIINSNKLIWIKDLPKELTIVGGGIIGLEFSAMFSHLGTKVTVIEFMDRVLANMDADISQEITNQLTNLGVKILTGHKVLDITNGKITAEVKETGEQVILDSPLNLIAIGRQAIIESEQLNALGINHTPKGIQVNLQMQTSIPNVYAVGDATGLSILAHVAIRQGIVAAQNIMGQNTNMDYSVIPAVVYTLPEVATVGTVPAELANINVVKFPFTANLKANIEQHNSGFAKLWVNLESNTLVAAQVIGDAAGEVIQLYANLIAFKTDIKLASQVIYAHPTYGEIVKNSLEYALGNSIEYS